MSDNSAGKVTAITSFCSSGAKLLLLLFDTISFNKGTGSLLRCSVFTT